MNDWQLVSAYAQGDEQAFETLVRQFFPLVYSAAVRQVSDRHVAEEIAQSVFILFARKAAKLSSSVSLTGWFLRTTRFVARDVLKQMYRRRKREEEAAALAALQQGWEPDWTAPAPLVDEALLALSADEQACVISRFLEGRSFREIGERHGVTEDAAQKRVSRSLDKMRAFLERRGVKVAVTSIAGLLTVDFARAAGPQLIEATLQTVQAAAHGGASTAGALLADSVARALVRRVILKLSMVAVVSIVLIGGLAGWLQTRPGIQTTSFQVSDARLDGLGRAWAVVVQRAAFLMGFPQGRPPAGNPNRAAYDQATAFVLTETTRVSTELNAVLQPGREREQVAEFLTVELRETLGLDARQQAEVFSRLRMRAAEGTTFEDGMRSLWQSKAAFATELRQGLSAQQTQRFNQTYGTNAIGLLAFPGLVLGSQ